MNWGTNIYWYKMWDDIEYLLDKTLAAAYLGIAQGSLDYMMKVHMMYFKEDLEIFLILTLLWEMTPSNA
jgi:hypothetical protein